MQRRTFFGLMFLAAAAALAFLARDASHSFGDQFRRVFTGHFSDRTTFLFAAAIVCALLGAFLVVTKTTRLSRHEH